jgi:RimJ/RimL family protein N-acetyltransferase
MLGIEIMIRDSKISIKNTARDDLVSIFEIEQGEARQFIQSYTLDRHQVEFAKPEVKYKSIWWGEELVGFLILVLDLDGRSVEFRRVVISKPGSGYGKIVIKELDEICRNELGRSRIWLDVFKYNERARHVYEKCGYSQFGKSTFEGKPLLLYEKLL